MAGVSGMLCQSILDCSISFDPVNKCIPQHWAVTLQNSEGHSTIQQFYWDHSNSQREQISETNVMSEQSVDLCTSSPPKRYSSRIRLSDITPWTEEWAAPRRGSCLGAKLAGCYLLHL